MSRGVVLILCGLVVTYFARLFSMSTISMVLFLCFLIGIASIESGVLCIVMSLFNRRAKSSKL